MTEENQLPDLFEIGRESLEAFKKEFASYGIECDPEIELRKGAGMLCYYDFNDRQIYLSMPDLKAPTGKLQMMMFRQMICAETNEELMRFLAIFIPFVVSHEMTHHFRHRYGLFGEDSWQEEQLANKMAAAVNKHRIPPEEKAFAVNFLERAMKKLGEQLGIGENAFDAYYDIAHALQTSDHISDADMDNFKMAQGALPASSSATMMLRKSSNLTDSINQRLGNRRKLISSFNEQYAEDPSRYIYYQVGWVYLAMKSAESSYVDEFARAHLNLLPVYKNITLPQKYEARAIYALYRASQETKSNSITISRYFYKRYRAFLLDYLQKTYSAIMSKSKDSQNVNFDILSIWDDRTSDSINFLTGMFPAFVREIFPSQIGKSPALAGLNMTLDLPTPEDIQIWEYANDKKPGAAQTTLDLFQQFDSLDLFRALPPETLVELGKKFYRVKFAAGETLLWEHETNNDVFVLIDGQLEALVGGREKISIINPGEVFGEIAWLTNDPRVATVRAVTPSTCIVIKDSDLQMLAYKNPSILMSIARTIAKRFRDARKN